jgi:hypothetical protein
VFPCCSRKPSVGFRTQDHADGLAPTLERPEHCESCRIYVKGNLLSSTDGRLVRALMCPRQLQEIYLVGSSSIVLRDGGPQLKPAHIG